MLMLGAPFTGAIIMPVPAKRKFGLKLMGRAVTKISDGGRAFASTTKGRPLFDA